NKGPMWVCPRQRNWILRKQVHAAAHHRRLRASRSGSGQTSQTMNLPRFKICRGSREARTPRMSSMSLGELPHTSKRSFDSRGHLVATADEPFGSRERSAEATFANCIAEGG